MPAPEDVVQPKEVGRTVFSALKTTMYRSLCDPKSEVYKAWMDGGLKLLFSRAYVGGTIAALFSEMQIGIRMAAASVAALIFRFGIDVYCERYKPRAIMIHLSDKADD